MARPEIYIDGNLLEGWQRLEVKRSMYTAAGTFSFALQPPNSGMGGNELLTLRIKAGAKVEIVGEQTQQLVERFDWKRPDRKRVDVVTSPYVPIASGYIDKVRTKVEGVSHTIEVVGRDYTGQLVDCSAPWQPGEFKDFTLVQLVRAMAEPFGVDVAIPLEEELEPLTGPFGSTTVLDDITTRKLPLFRVEAGETAWTAIERACRIFGVLVYSSEVGALVLGSTGLPGGSIALKEGRNVTSFMTEESHSDRYSSYQVVGQSSGNDDFNGPASAHARGESVDPGITLHRPLTIVGEDSMTADTAQSRAEWESAVRAAQSSEVIVTHPAWNREGFSGHSGLWRINELVPVDLPSVGMSGRMLIVETVYTINSENQESARIRLAREDAFLREPSLDSTKDPFSVARNQQFL